MRQMKDSGIEWLGNIPETWNVTPIKYLLEENKKKNKDFDERNALQFKMGAIVKKIKDNDEIDNLEGTYSKYIIVNEGDVVVNGLNLSFDFITQRVALVEERGLITSTYFVVTPSDEIDERFLNYLLKSYDNCKALHSMGRGLRSILTFNEFRKYSLVYPLVDEQEKIANYLDRKVALIDNIIEKTKKSIEEYKKYKQSLITEIVTKGLNPDVKMKDSGVEWIGNIPEHWDIIKLRFLGSLHNGISKRADQFGSGTPFVSYGDAYKNYELPYEVEGLVDATDADKHNYSIQKGDVLFTRTSETIEEIGFASTCMKTIEDATFAGFLIRFRPYSNDAIDGYYSKYFFRSDMHRRFFVKEMNLVTRASLSQGLLKKLPVILPPIEEQNDVGLFLEEKCNEINNTINQKSKIIVKLESYKKSLIYEVVTGKKEIK